MQPHRLTYAETDRFAPIVLDHLAGDPFVASLSSHPPTLEGILAAAEARTFSENTRATVCRVIERQYEGVTISDAVRSSMEFLRKKDALTITTGHQLNLFTGPLYVPLKILNVVKVSQRVSSEMQGRPVVPIFWMATEDHDRAEIDHTYINGEKIQWPGEPGGAVGRMSTKGIQATLEAAKKALGPGSNADRIKELIEHCYGQGHSLANATRLFVNELFGRFGVVCLDADDLELKRIFLRVMKQELLEGSVHRLLRYNGGRIGDRYKVQAHAREINLFYLGEGKRSRIILRDGYIGPEGGPVVSRKELLCELEEHPERFSPNVLMRPLYQESILPNIAYVGGGGELAYWLQLRPLFAHFELPMPVLLLRSSVSILPYKEFERMEDLGLTLKDLFLPKAELQARVARTKAGFSTDMDREKEGLFSFYEDLKMRAKEVDPTLVRSAASARNLAFKGLDHLEKRFIRAAKAKCDQELSRLEKVLGVMFPDGGLQERRENFSTFHSLYGDAFFEELLKHLDPLDHRFTVLVEDPIVPAVGSDQ